MSQSPPAGTDGRPGVELRLPADSAYASVLRTTTASLAARLDFTIDDIEDLRIAVGEANAMVLEHARPGGELTAAYLLSPGRLTVTIGADTDGQAVPDLDSFAWQVLTTLASSADFDVEGDRFAVRLTMVSSLLDAASGAPQV